MADNIEKSFQQRAPRTESSATGWIAGIIIALIAIAALWYYGIRQSDVTTTKNTSTNTITTEPPATTTPSTPAPGTTAPATGTGGTTTPPPATPAPANP